jgi:N-methylhydantoinase A/oxoprolinase/acetone carboxylase beta subunit
MLVAPVSYNLSRSYPKRLAEIAPRALDALWEALESDALEVLEKTASGARVHFDYAIDVRYAGQGSALTLPLPVAEGARLPEVDPEAVTRTFFSAYSARYGHAYADTPLAVARLRLTARVGAEWTQVAATVPSSARGAEAARKGTRKAYSPVSGAWEDFVVYDRYRLPTDARIVGPAIVEEAECTTLVGPGVEAKVHREGHLILDMPEAVS